MVLPSFWNSLNRKTAFELGKDEESLMKKGDERNNTKDRECNNLSRDITYASIDASTKASSEAFAVQSRAKQAFAFCICLLFVISSIKHCSRFTQHVHFNFVPPVHISGGRADTDPSPDHQVIAEHGAVACDVPLCSEMGVDILKRGGSAVDAAVTVALCIGSINSFSSGIGGGGFMTVFDPDTESLAFNFRETAPAAAFKDMYEQYPLNSRIGGLAAGVPGEISGLYEAFSRYSSGVLSWAELIQPVIDLNRDGFEVQEPLASVIQLFRPYWLFHEEQWKFFMVMKDGHPEFAELGDVITRPKLADTLEIIAQNGSSAVFYDPEGPIAPKLVTILKEYGGIMTLDDIANYNVIITEPLRGQFQDREVLTTPNPTSGPALLIGLQMLEILAGGEDLGNLDTHHLVETMKWLSSAKTRLGDSADQVKMAEVMSKEWVNSAVENISDSYTMPWWDYDPLYDDRGQHGTAHFSVLDGNGMAVAMTTTINQYFGNVIADPETGIILNDEMDDFSQPKRSNGFDLMASPYNFIYPFKRPLSSCVPSVVVNNRTAELVIGAAGGSHIVTSVLQAIVRTFQYKTPLLETIAYPRVHHQLLPNVVYVERGVDDKLVHSLEDRGHTVEVGDPRTAMNGIYRLKDGPIVAVSDWWRKRGHPAGY